jgi:hypothetical protein
MKITETYTRTDMFECAACGLGTGPTEDVDYDDSGIPYPPAGWARVTVEMVVRSAEYEEAHEDREAKISLQLAAAEGQMNRKLTADESKQAREAAELLIPTIEVDEFTVEKSTIALCAAHVGDIAKLGVEVA